MCSTEYVLLQATNGLVVGMLYALAAVGLTLVFSVLKVVNFAHGEFYMMGAYAGYYAVQLLGVPPIASVAVAVALAAPAGWLVERLLLSPLHDQRVERKDEYALLVTFGLSVLLQNLAIVSFGPFSRRPPSFLQGTVSWSILAISYDRLLAAATAALLLLGLWAFLRLSRWGKALDAVSQSRESAAIVGIDPGRFYGLGFAIGAALAAAAGVLMAPIFSISPTVGVLPAIKSFVIVVLGGLGSVAGSIVAGLLIGVSEGLWVALFPDPDRALAYSHALAVLVLAVTLLVRPTGLFGRPHVRME